MRRTVRLLLPALLAAAALAGCGGDEQEAAPPAAADATDLSVEITKAKPEPIHMQLHCSGTCDVARLDEALRGAENSQRACTAVYGGPEQAHVTGTVEGRAVDITLDRSDGCGIAAYEDLFAAFGRKPPLAG